MTGPFIFIATNRLKQGKLESEKKRLPQLIDFVQANEPRLIAFNEYANEEGTEVAVVQVHPDADSMVFHMELIAERAASAYADTIDATTNIQVFGAPSAPSPRCYAYFEPRKAMTARTRSVKSFTRR